MYTLQTGALAAAEALINKALQHDPATRQTLAQLAGKVVQLQLTQPQLDIYLCPRGDRLDLQGQCELPVACLVRGRLLDMLKLADGQQLNLAGSGVQVTGETQLLLTLKNCLEGLDIDWEDWLASYLGDDLAHPLAAGFAQLHRYGKQQAANLQGQLEPYLTEELQLLPSRTALAQFGAEVDQLALAADRLEARLAALRAQLKTTHH